MANETLFKAKMKLLPQNKARKRMLYSFDDQHIELNE